MVRRVTGNPSRILLAACLLALAVGVAAHASAAPTPTPKAQVRVKVLSPRVAHLIATPEGKKLMVAVPVRYGLRVSGDSTPGTLMTVRLAGKAKLPSGRTLAAAADSRRYPGASDRTVDHHLFFSAAQTRQLLAAWKSARTSASPSAAGISIITQASASARTEGGAEAGAEAEGSAPLPQPTPPSEGEIPAGRRTRPRPRQRPLRLLQAEELRKLLRPDDQDDLLLPAQDRRNQVP
jgi:hypothetical protein